MSDKYIMEKDGTLRPADFMEWARWLEKSDRKIAEDMVGDVLVSTVFLGLDHSFGNGPPLLFETMVFGGPLDGDQDRYETREGALLGHAVMLAKVDQASAKGAK